MKNILVKLYRLHLTYRNFEDLTWLLAELNAELCLPKWEKNIIYI